MENTTIKYCASCAQGNITHEFQDKMYGTFKRVFNIGEETGIQTCTVCNNGKKLKK